LINPVAQQELERLRRKQAEEAQREEEERRRREEEAQKAMALEASNPAAKANDSTLMFSLDTVKDELLEEALGQDKELRRERKRRQKERELAEEEESEDEDAPKNT